MSLSLSLTVALFAGCGPSSNALGEGDVAQRLEALEATVLAQGQRIEDLESDNASLRGQLDAAEASLDGIDGDIVTAADLAAYATQQWVEDQDYVKAANVGMVATIAYVDDAIDNAGFLTSADLTGYATQGWVNTRGYVTSGFLAYQGYVTSGALAPYATQSWVASRGYVTSGSLTPYATQSWVASRGYVTSGSLAARGYVTSGYVDNQGFVTDADLNGYATESWVEQQTDAITPGIEGLADYVSVDTNENTVTFTGANVQITSGSGATDDGVDVFNGGEPLGLGNLIIGYNLDAGADAIRTGSHNLIVGDEHSYYGTGAVVFGYSNAVYTNATVIGGANNVAWDAFSTLLGGEGNSTSQPYDITPN